MQFASVDIFIDQSDWSFRMGRPVANTSFLRALLTYGVADSYRFFCPDVAHQQIFRDRIGSWRLPPDKGERVRAPLQIELARALREQSFDVFHQADFSYYNPHLIEVRNRCAREPFPITGFTHSLNGQQVHLRYLELLLCGAEPFDAILCTSRAAMSAVSYGLDLLREQLAARFGARLPSGPGCYLMPLGIDDDLYRPLDRAACRRHFEVPDDTRVILTVGRYSLRQKMDWSPVLEMLARMEAHGELDRVVFVVAGGARESDSALLRTLVRRMGLEHRVQLFPNFPAELKSTLYGAADLFLSLVDNTQETFGLSILEAMAAGLPVIASDYSGYRDLVEDGMTGVLIPTVSSTGAPAFLEENLGVLDPSISTLYQAQMTAVDVERLRTVLNQLLSDSARRAAMGEQGRARAEQFRWSQLIPRYEALWRELKARAGRSGWTSRPAPALLAGDPLGGFAGFPSRRLEPEDRAVLTDLGRVVRTRPDLLTRYEEVQGGLSAALEHHLLEQLAAGGRTVGALRAAGAALEATSGDVDFHLLWLLKHGAVALV